MNERVLDNLRLELRRGSLILAVLGALNGERYGYTLRRELVEAGLHIEESALYPMLRRLEGQGLLASTWRGDGRRRRRFYRLLEPGEILLRQLTREWEEINVALERIVGEPGSPRGHGQGSNAAIDPVPAGSVERA